MGATYTRQSSSNIVDGNVIEASDINNEFNQLLAAFVASSGHTHDGTSAEGGPITKLLGTSLTLGDGTSGTDITLTFDGESNDGVLAWMEDEDYFQFSDDILINSTERLNFQDTGTYIYSSTDGQLDLVADTEIQIAATTIDINGAVALDGAITGATNITLSGELDAATLDISGDADIDGTLEADAITINGTGIGSIYQVLAGSSDTVTTGALNSGSITSGFGTIDTGSSTITTTGLISGGSLDIDDVLINGTTIGHTDDTDLMTLTSGVLTVAGEVDATSLDISGNADIDGTLETDALSIDGTTITSTAAEINILDGDNSASSVTVVDADRIILNDNGTMKQVAVSALNTYTSSSIAADDVSAGDAAVSIATSSGNVTIDSNAGSTTVDGHTGVTLQSSNSGDITLDSVADIVVDAAGGNVEFKDAGTLQFTIDMDGTSGVQIVKLGVDSDDLVFQQYDGNEVIRVADDRRLYFYDKGGEYIYGDGTDLHIVSGADINIPANIGMTFGDDGEKIEGDGTDLTISGNNINLTATADVVIPANVGVTFGSGEKIEGDSTDLTITSGADINLTATSDINVPANVGITIGNDGEKIEGDGTDLTIASSGVLNLAAGGSTNQIKVTDGAILPITDDDVDLGSASYQFKNAYFDGTLEADAITIGGSAITAGGATAGFAVAMAIAL